MQTVRLGVTGHRTICCVHDREKRIVTTEAQVAEIGLKAGYFYNPKQHHLWSCTCCENLFVDPSDEPRFCRVCSGHLRHQPAGPLPAPNERPIDG